MMKQKKSKVTTNTSKEMKKKILFESINNYNNNLEIIRYNKEKVICPYNTNLEEE